MTRKPDATWRRSMTAIMCGQAYLQSAIIAAQCPPLASATPLTASVEHQGGACPGYYVNREPFLDVIRMHRAEVNNIGKSRPERRAVHGAATGCADRRQPRVLGHGAALRRALRLPQLADHGAGADGHHRLHDGLRHDGHRAGPGAGEVQEAGGRRHDQDRQQHGAVRRCSSWATTTKK